MGSGHRRSTSSTTYGRPPVHRCRRSANSSGAAGAPSRPAASAPGLRHGQRQEMDLGHRHLSRRAQREGESVAALRVGVRSCVAARGEDESQVRRRIGDDRTEEGAGGLVGPLEVLHDQNRPPQGCRQRAQGPQDAMASGARIVRRRRCGRQEVREVGQQPPQRPGQGCQVHLEGTGEAQRLDERCEREGGVRLLAAGDQGDGARRRYPREEFAYQPALSHPRLTRDHDDGGPAVEHRTQVVQDRGASDQDTGGGGRRVGVHGFLPHPWAAWARRAVRRGRAARRPHDGRARRW
ncbi:hypothetical protein SMICM17S_10661 [Streptomyces microflavus]